jgi:hypothetical protein
MRLAFRGLTHEDRGLSFYGPMQMNRLNGLIDRIRFNEKSRIIL